MCEQDSLCRKELVEVVQCLIRTLAVFWVGPPGRRLWQTQRDEILHLAWEHLRMLEDVSIGRRLYGTSLNWLPLRLRPGKASKH